MSDAGAPGGFYRTLETGQVVCGVCAEPAYTHAPTCPVIALHTQLRELAAQLGLFVATLRETLDTSERLLRGDAPGPSATLPPPLGTRLRGD